MGIFSGKKEPEPETDGDIIDELEKQLRQPSRVGFASLSELVPDSKQEDAPEKDNSQNENELFVAKDSTAKKIEVKIPPVDESKEETVTSKSERGTDEITLARDNPVGDGGKELEHTSRQNKDAEVASKVSSGEKLNSNLAQGIYLSAEENRDDTGGPESLNNVAKSSGSEPAKLVNLNDSTSTFSQKATSGKIGFQNGHEEKHVPVQVSTKSGYTHSVAAEDNRSATQNVPKKVQDETLIRENLIKKMASGLADSVNEEVAKSEMEQEETLEGKLAHPLKVLQDVDQAYLKVTKRFKEISESLTELKVEIENAKSDLTLASQSLQQLNVKTATDQRVSSQRGFSNHEYTELVKKLKSELQTAKLEVERVRKESSASLKKQQELELKVNSLRLENIVLRSNITKQ